MNKRGLSPLVATILLIGFSIALGAIVMSWGKGFIEEKAEFVQGVEASPLECSKVGIKVIEIGNQPEICIEGDTIKALIENGPVTIDNIQARVVSASGISTTESIAPGKIGKAQSVQASFPGAGAKQVKLTPYIVINREKEYCTQKAITFENIRTC